MVSRRDRDSTVNPDSEVLASEAVQLVTPLVDLYLLLLSGSIVFRRRFDLQRKPVPGGEASESHPRARRLREAASIVHHLHEARRQANHDLAGFSIQEPQERGEASPFSFPSARQPSTRTVAAATRRYTLRIPSTTVSSTSAIISGLSVGKKALQTTATAAPTSSFDIARPGT